MQLDRHLEIREVPVSIEVTGSPVLAKSALKVAQDFADSLPYARVDMVSNSKGEPVIMKVELIEPNLFMVWSEGPVTRFVEVIGNLAARRHSRR